MTGGRSGAEILGELHDAMLPKGLPVPQGVEIAARYLLAEDYTGAGGDWFDAIPLADGRVVLVVGDVVGHGIAASVVMNELKTLFEERVRADGDVPAALALLDGRATRTAEARSTTLCAAVLDTRSGELTYTTAGHPPPVLITDGSASFLPTTGAGPLGSGRGFPIGSHVLGEGDLLLLYSDGLVERPGQAATQSTVELLRAAEVAVGDGPDGEAPGGDETLVERVSRQVLELLTRDTGYADDITLLAAQLVPPVAPLDLHLPAVPDAVRTVRADLGDWLAGLRVAELDRMAIQHAVGELVSNAVAHAYEEVGVGNPVHVEARLTPDGEIVVTVGDRGRWRPSKRGDGGRGLALASGFLDELTVEHDAAGTRARGRYRVSHPAVLLRGTAPQVAEPPAHAAGLGIDDDVLHVAGSLDLRSADELRHACARASRGGTRRVTINLAEVDVLSSAAVQALFDTRASGPVDLVAPMGSPAQHVLDLVQLPYRS
ncbi:SpoIIE family protein phosphatase [Nocardioides pyridinolyticus]